ncbi:uncharacterized protein LOC123549354 isoform X2 [Mercenaria mercenaria]|uniref:uncharacterized protein LOC123549354 isoform X2 n=1 Tax=Mercenaria mercenaria TaxID=6596 RepID=UPI00234F23DC|nr:uncharacterized protein LOC123549354 isoform X2 [Mercenaria mercenaria]
MLAVDKRFHKEGNMDYGGFNGTDLDDIYADYYLNYPPLPPTSLENFVKYFYMIVFPYFLLTGTIGNILGTVIMRRYSHNVWSTCMYMSLVFPMDLIQLYVECGNDWLSKLYKDEYNLSKEILLLSNAVCKVYTFVYNFILSQSEWIRVAIGIETAIAITKPNWIYTMCTRERASAIALFISVLLISINLHFFWTHGLIKPGEDPSIKQFYCTYINELSNSFRDYIWPIINLCIEDAIPLLVNVICITISIPSLAAKREPDAQQDTFLEKYFLDVKALCELKVAAFVTCIVTVLYLVSNIILKALIYELLEIEYEQSMITKTCVVVFTYVILSHKFWIFYISCEKFRQDVKEMGRSMCRPFRRKTGKTYTQAPTLSDKTPEATASWQESETSFSKGAQGTYKATT